MKIAFLLYPTEGVKPDEDLSFWMHHELQKRGKEVYYFEDKHLFWKDGEVQAFLTPAFLDTKRGYLPSPHNTQPTTLASLDCIFIRKEPPFNNAYLYSLQLLDTLKGRVFILNDARGIAMCNEKLFCHFEPFELSS